MIKFDDGTGIGMFNARLREREIFPAAIDKPVLWTPGTLRPYAGRSRFTWKKINLSIEFSGGGDQFTIEANKGSFINYFDGRFITFDDIPGWRFFVVIDGEPSLVDTFRGHYQTMNVSLLGYMETATELTGLVTGGVIRPNNTNTETPATITISGADVVTVTLGAETFKVTNIGAGTVTIGDGKVLKNGVNHWQYTELTKFPRLLPGPNTFTKTPAGAIVTVKYRGRLI